MNELSYEQAKELKDAGFPQMDSEWYWSTYGLECFLISQNHH